MRAFLQQFGGCLELLRRLPPRPQPGGDADMVDAGSGGTASGTGGEEAYRHSVEATVNTFLVLMTNMRWVCNTLGRFAVAGAAVHLQVHGLSADVHLFRFAPAVNLQPCSHGHQLAQLCQPDCGARAGGRCAFGGNFV